MLRPTSVLDHIWFHILKAITTTQIKSGKDSGNPGPPDFLEPRGLVRPNHNI